MKGRKRIWGVAFAGVAALLVVALWEGEGTERDGRAVIGSASTAEADEARQDLLGVTSRGARTTAATGVAAEDDESIVLVPFEGAVDNQWPAPFLETVSLVFWREREDGAHETWSTRLGRSQGWRLELPPGTWNVRGVMYLCGPTIDVIPAQVDTNDPPPILSLDPETIATGRVIDSAGNAVPGVEVWHNNCQSRSDHDGFFAVPGRPDDLKVREDTLPIHLDIERTEHGSLTESALLNAPYEKLIVLRRCRALRGQAFDEDGAPISDAALTLIGIENGASYETTTGMAGTFELERIVPGAYTARAIVDVSAPGTLEAMTPLTTQIEIDERSPIDVGPLILSAPPKASEEERLLNGSGTWNPDY